VSRRFDEACICDKAKGGELIQLGIERVVRIRVRMQCNQSRFEAFACA
jgi:hypothetical protein